MQNGKGKTEREKGKGERENTLPRREAVIVLHVHDQNVQLHATVDVQPFDGLSMPLPCRIWHSLGPVGPLQRSIGVGERTRSHLGRLWMKNRQVGGYLVPLGRMVTSLEVGGRAWKLEVSSLFSVPCHECRSHKISAPNWHQFTTYWFASSITYLSEGCLARQTRQTRCPEPAVKCASLLGVPCSSFNLNQSAAVKTNRGATRVIKDGVMGALNPRVGSFGRHPMHLAPLGTNILT